MNVISKFIEDNINLENIIEDIIKDIFDNKDLTTLEIELTDKIKFNCVIHSDFMEKREKNDEALWCGYCSFDFGVIRFSLILK